MRSLGLLPLATYDQCRSFILRSYNLTQIIKIGGELDASRFTAWR